MLLPFDCTYLQVLDLSGMSAMQIVSHMRSPSAQREWQYNMDFVPELLYKVSNGCRPGSEHQGKM